MSHGALQIDIVSAEAHLFSGNAKMIIASSLLGELGIVARHAPLLALLQPGPIRVQKEDGEEELFYVSGGILEIQQELRPESVTVVTVLSDVAARAADLDEARVQEAKQRAEQLLSENISKLEYAEAAAELLRAVAQLRTIKDLRKKYQQ
jgi:F-type H+-transporting ATPase subunit epsilon